MLLQYHHIFLQSNYNTIKIIICDIEQLLQCHPIFAMALQHYVKKIWHIPCLPVWLWAVFELNCKLELTCGISKCQCECFKQAKFYKSSECSSSTRQKKQNVQVQLDFKSSLQTMTELQLDLGGSDPPNFFQIFFQCVCINFNNLFQ